MLLLMLSALCAIGNVVSVCPRGWLQHGQSCYHVNNEPANWIGAMRICELHKGRLADISSAQEQNFLHYTLLHHYKPADYWVGGTDWENEGDWVWESANRKIAYTHWLPGQPNNGRSPFVNPQSGTAEFQNCLSLRYQDDFRWVDSVCAEELHYICEISAAVPVQMTTQPVVKITHTTPTMEMTTTTTTTTTTTMSTPLPTPER